MNGVGAGRLVAPRVGADAIDLVAVRGGVMGYIRAQCLGALLFALRCFCPLRFKAPKPPTAP